MVETIAPEAQARHWMIERRLAGWFAAMALLLGAGGVVALRFAAEAGGPWPALLLLAPVVAGPLLVLLLTCIHTLRQSGVDEDLDASDA